MPAPDTITEAGPELLSVAGDAAVLAEVAKAAAAVEVRDLAATALPDYLGVSLPAGRRYTVMDLEDYHLTPRRKLGTVHVEDPESLAAYVNQHKTPATTLWANRATGQVLAVLNDHEPNPDPGAGTPGWADHRATLQLVQTEDWRHWAKLNGQFVDQVRFAEHLDDGAASIVAPSAADMIALAQRFQASRSVTFLSAARIQTGDTALTYEETTSARAGQKGTIEIPDTILLRIAPWEGCPEYDLAARFRYRIKDGSLVLGYRMVRPDLLLREAFGVVLAAIHTETGITAYLGTR
jgi:uncharacterized protein YfdQ (DUF2303 family)